MLKKLKEEKKVEYLELIYDLIFVYVIGRNNSLLHDVSGGFVQSGAFIAYILCTLAVIQIWNYSTFYINRFGRNDVREYICLFINMYLLYYIAEGTRLHWESFQNQYHIAWGLILVNLGIQYVIELRNHREEPGVQTQIKIRAAILFIQAVIVFAAVPVFNRTGTVLSGVAILFGIIATLLTANRTRIGLIDFNHLSERAMLYVVFTFGEMIITAGLYFEGDFTGNSLYFSLLCFLIIVGLFLLYGILYNRIVDRDMDTNGTGYMLIHLFLIFALNNITSALMFMQDSAVDLRPKILFLIGSFLLCFICVFAMGRYAKPDLRPNGKTFLLMLAVLASFTALMLLFRRQMYVNIAVTVLYVFGICLLLLRFIRRTKNAGPDAGTGPEQTGTI